jgi:hypothetical protein
VIEVAVDVDAPRYAGVFLDTLGLAETLETAGTVGFAG